MRAVQLGQMPQSATIEERLTWIERALHELEFASQEEIVFDLLSIYTLTNIPDPPDRTLSGTETTAADIAAVLTTVLADLKARAFRK